jgi:hypothetical protein
MSIGAHWDHEPLLGAAPAATCVRLRDDLGADRGSFVETVSLDFGSPWLRPTRTEHLSSYFVPPVGRDCVACRAPMQVHAKMPTNSMGVGHIACRDGRGPRRAPPGGCFDTLYV